MNSRDNCISIIEDCYFDLRYPLWHVDTACITSSTMTSNCRAPLWYSHNIQIKESYVGGVKAVRECKNIEIIASNIESNDVSKALTAQNGTSIGLLGSLL
jgi:hypothetical protein